MPTNGSKNDKMAPRTTRRCPHEGPRVDSHREHLTAALLCVCRPKITMPQLMALVLLLYLAHKKLPTPLGPPQGPRLCPSVGSQGGPLSYERGTPDCQMALLDCVCCHASASLAIKHVNHVRSKLILPGEDAKSVGNWSSSMLPEV